MLKRIMFVHKYGQCRKDKRKEYAFRQFDEKSSIIPGCLVWNSVNIDHASSQKEVKGTLCSKPQTVVTMLYSIDEL